MEKTPNIARQMPILVDESPTTEGMGIVATVGPERQPITPESDPSKIEFVATSKRPWQTKFSCGHKGHGGHYLVYGTKFKPRSKENCPECGLAWFQKHAVRCCLCGLAIIPGQPVAIYDTQSVEKKDFDFTTTNDGTAVIGCLRWDCCPSGGFFCGHLAEDKQIEPYEPH